MNFYHLYHLEKILVLKNKNIRSVKNYINKKPQTYGVFGVFYNGLRVI